MVIELLQQLKLSQQLTMTPQLNQAIKLLQLSRLELVEMIQQELIDNPFLEEESEVESTAISVKKIKRQVDIGYPKFGMDLQGKGKNEDLINSADWEDYLGEFSGVYKQTQSRNNQEIFEESPSVEARLASKPSLEGHLNWQMRLSNFTKREIAIGEAVIGNLNSNGYLCADYADIQVAVPDAGEQEIEAVIHRIQRLDPVGVAARNLRECLMVQLEVLGDTDPILISLVRDHLEDIGKKRYKLLARKFKVDLEELKHYLEIIQKLDPMSGVNFSNTEPFYVLPDVFVYKYGDDFVIILNEDGLPQLQLNKFLAENSFSITGKDKAYIQNKMRSATWFIKSLYYRQRTLYKVVESILNFQRDFLKYGITRLRPLILKVVADDISMHESTVSRITTNKYIATPHGVFELKFFFNSGLNVEDGSQVGSESIKALIKKLIDEEDHKYPLSDNRIGKVLKNILRVNIARRTVGKYRLAMNILSSSKRKALF